MREKRINGKDSNSRTKFKNAIQFLRTFEEKTSRNHKICGRIDKNMQV